MSYSSYSAPSVPPPPGVSSYAAPPSSYSAPPQPYSSSGDSYRSSSNYAAPSSSSYRNTSSYGGAGTSSYRDHRESSRERDRGVDRSYDDSSRRDRKGYVPIVLFCLKFDIMERESEGTFGNTLWIDHWCMGCHLYIR